MDTREALERRALATMVYEAVRFASWAAGEGICPVANEPALDPADILSAYVSVIDGDDYAGLEIVARDAILAAPPQAQEPVAMSVAGIAHETDMVALQIEEGSGFWKSCSGCYETEDGQNVHGYPYSTVFKCIAGSGCAECGGIGVIWDATDYDDMARDMLAAHPSAAPAGAVTREEIAKTIYKLRWPVSSWGHASPTENAWAYRTADAILALLSRAPSEPLVEIAQADPETPPCGECHLQPDEVCDICGRRAPSDGATKSDGGAKAVSSTTLAAEGEQRGETHGMTPVGNIAANLASTEGSPSDTNAPSDDWRAGVEAAAKVIRDAAEGYSASGHTHSAIALAQTEVLIRALTPPTKGGADGK